MNVSKNGAVPVTEIKHANFEAKTSVYSTTETNIKMTKTY
jgi:hypothetical protein